jgi:hypothetical protein
MRKALSLIRMLLWLELAERIHEIADRLDVRGFRLLKRARERWPDFDDYAHSCLSTNRRTPEAHNDA